MVQASRRRFRPSLDVLPLRITPSDVVVMPTSTATTIVTPLSPTLIGAPTPTTPVTTPLSTTIIGWNPLPPVD